MKKLFLVTALFLFLLFLINLFEPKKVFAQVSIQCGYENERCCNFAGSTPDSCKSPLTCINNICVSTTNPGRYTRPKTGKSTLHATQKMYCDSSDNPTTAVTGKLYTAIGCIPVDNLELFISSILGWAIGIGGGIAFLLIIYSGFMIMTSSGNPERLKAGQELLTSAIAGLIMLIFSVFILRVIGVDILKIPGITTTSGMR
ncbi:MAG: pilin [Patescibacteria group bacterium]